MPKSVDMAMAKALAQSNLIRGALVVGQTGGWGVLLQIGMDERPLRAKRGQDRIFVSLSAVQRLLVDDLGILKFTVDATHYLSKEGVGRIAI